ncbi:uncharacterized protein LOC128210256 [Mya arenaria]|uniref:uncharacterized protein LOC128210256 n=1 Tax=Mya arenaria TaxID=6604 RepID=UPI0022E7DF60|nr:uncharacterized protein LOC128210256 [Mya arenaria]
MVIGVAGGVGFPVVLAIVVIGLIFMRRRGMICRSPIKETEAHANAAYWFANGDVLFSTPALYTEDNVHQDDGDDNCQFNDNGSGYHIYANTNTFVNRVNNHNSKTRENDSNPPHGKQKKQYCSARDNQSIAQETTTTGYENVCFKDSTKLVQRNDYVNVHLHPGDYNNTLEDSNADSVAYFGGNRAQKCGYELA